MALVVQKFGGTSVGTTERIRNVARRALEARDRGDQVVVVVSAMSGETNRLLGLARDLAEVPDARELDVIASTGEQVTSGLLALAIQQEGGKARSFLGHQVCIRTDGAFTKARIRSIDDTKLRQALDAGAIAVVAGFQGIDEEGNITTLGRGGSDTSAVAVAAALSADVCEIYTDVDGVYTTDPNVCPSARKIAKISYEEMLELASLGAKVLQIRSVEIAMRHKVAVHVRSSFSDAEGTWVVAEESSGLEEVTVAGVAYDRNDACVQILGINDQPGVAAELFGTIADHNVSVDMIVQSATPGERSELTFTMAKTDLERAKPIIEATAARLGSTNIVYDTEVTKVSIVGLGMRTHAGIAAKMFRLLAGERINILAISTSEIKVSCLIPAKYTELAVRVLHDGFGLDQA